MRILIAAVAVAMLAGCASSAISVQDAKPVPSDEIYAFQAKPAGESGKITVVRDSGAVGSGCDIVVYIDGRKAAKIGTGQRATFYLPQARRISAPVSPDQGFVRALQLEPSLQLSSLVRKVYTASAAIWPGSTLVPTSITTDKRKP